RIFMRQISLTDYFCKGLMQIFEYRICLMITVFCLICLKTPIFRLNQIIFAETLKNLPYLPDRHQAFVVVAEKNILKVRIPNQSPKYRNHIRF
ncbi:hypothetical protein, partial [Neisseria meningitidis]